jgi:hypothetical protein
MLRFDLRTRTKMAEAGIYQQHDGHVIYVEEMPDPHLVYALLKALREADSVRITRPLAAEVKRRKLEDYAMLMARVQQARIIRWLEDVSHGKASQAAARAIATAARRRARRQKQAHRPKAQAQKTRRR